MHAWSVPEPLIGQPGLLSAPVSLWRLDAKWISPDRDRGMTTKIRPQNGHKHLNPDSLLVTWCHGFKPETSGDSNPGAIQTPWYWDKLTPILWPEILNPFCPVFLLFTTMGVNRNAVSVGAHYGQDCPGLWHRLWQMCLMCQAITMLMTMRQAGTSEKKWASLPPHPA